MSAVVKMRVRKCRSTYGKPKKRPNTKLLALSKYCCAIIFELTACVRFVNWRSVHTFSLFSDTSNERRLTFKQRSQDSTVAWQTVVLTAASRTRRSRVTSISCLENVPRLLETYTYTYTTICRRPYNVNVNTVNVLTGSVAKVRWEIIL